MVLYLLVIRGKMRRVVMDGRDVSVVWDKERKDIGEY